MFCKFLLQVVHHKVLVALNNVCSTARAAVAEHLMKRGIVDLMLPLCSSMSKKIRSQAVWVLGNLAATEGPYSRLVLKKEVVSTIVEVRVRV